MIPPALRPISFVSAAMWAMSTLVADDPSTQTRTSSLPSTTRRLRPPVCARWRYSQTDQLQPALQRSSMRRVFQITAETDHVSTKSATIP